MPDLQRPDRHRPDDRVGRAIVRHPSPALADGLVTHIDRSPVDLTVALAQWHAYREALRSHGWDVEAAPPALQCPDAVFVEDVLVVFDELAVVTSPGAPERRAETDGLADYAAGLGLETARLDGRGTLDGGDVLKVGRTAYVGLSGRTDADGVAALGRLLEPRGWRVVGVPLRSVLHLKSAVTALPDGSVIGFPPLVDEPDAFPVFRAVPEEAGAHVVLLGGDALLMSSAAPRTAELFASWGYAPVLVDIGEYEKLEGCVTCLSVRIRHSR